MKPKEVIEFAQEERRQVRRSQVHRSSRASGSTRLPRAQRLDEALFEDGIGFDGSSVRGWQPINASRHAR